MGRDRRRQASPRTRSRPRPAARALALATVGLFLAADEAHAQSEPTPSPENFFAVSYEDYRERYMEAERPNDLLFRGADGELRLNRIYQFSVGFYGDDVESGANLDFRMDLPTPDFSGDEPPEPGVYRVGPYDEGAEIEIPGCDVRTGRVEVLDLAYTELNQWGDYRLERVHARFDLDCYDGSADGEFRWESPDASESELQAAPSVKKFSTEHVAGDSSAPRPIDIRNFASTPQTIGAAALSGLDSRHFEIADDDCSGAVLAPNASCAVDVAFAPESPGPKAALLRFGSDPESLPPVELSGRAPIAQGEFELDYSPRFPESPAPRQTDVSAAVEPGTELSVDVLGDRDGIGIAWSDDEPKLNLGGSFATGSERSLEVGRYEIDGRRYDNDEWLNRASGSLSGCTDLRWVDIDAIDFVEGEITKLSMSWFARCEFESDDSGSFEYEVPGARDPPQPVRDLEISRDGSEASIEVDLPDDPAREKTIVRYAQDDRAPRSIDESRLAGSGTGTTATITGLDPDRPLAVSAWTVAADGSQGRRVSSEADAATSLSSPDWAVSERNGDARVVSGPETEFSTYAYESEEGSTLSVQWRKGEEVGLGAAAVFGTEAPELRPGTYLSAGPQGKADAYDPASGSELLHDPGCYGGGATRYDVKEIELSDDEDDNEIERLWMTWSSLCMGRRGDRHSGEVRLGMEERAPGLSAIASSVRFPNAYPRSGRVRSTIVTVRNDAAQPLSPGAPEITGPQAADFRVTHNRCDEVRLEPGASCEVALAFSPAGVGPRFATLRLGAGDGLAAASSTLEGFGIRERTSIAWTDKSTTHPITPPGSHRLEPADSLLSVPGSDTEILRLGLLPRDAVYATEVQLGVHPGFGGEAIEIAEGRYVVDPNQPRGSGYISAPLSCYERYGGWFEIERLRRDSFGNVNRLEADWDLRCANSTKGEQTGRLEFGVPPNDATPPARPTGLRVQRDGARATVSWQNPVLDHERTIVTWAYGPAAPIAPDAGMRAYEGRGQTTTIEGLDPGRRISVAVFALDSAGYYGPAEADTPLDPRIDRLDPESPSSQNRVRVIGRALADAQVDVFADSRCQGSPVASGPGSLFSATGIAVDVASDRETMLRVRARDPETGEVSGCSRAMPYVEDSTPPHIGGIYVPEGPRNDNWAWPTIWVYEGIVDIYTTPGCSGEPAASYNAGGWEGTPKIQVPDDSTTTFRVIATDAVGNSTGCSTESATYTEDSTPPVPPKLTQPDSPGDAVWFVLRAVLSDDTDYVSVFNGPACAGEPIESSQRYWFDNGHVRLWVPPGESRTYSAVSWDKASNRSTCSNVITYRALPSLVPPVPDRARPSAASHDRTPLISGTVPEEHADSVRLYAGPRCEGEPIGRGSVGSFRGEGIEVSVPAESETEIHATGVLDNGRVSACSESGFTYRHDTVPPETDLFDLGPVRRPNVELESNEDGSSFQCRADGKPWKACEAALRVPRGVKLFRARAIDRAGNIDPTPSRLRLGR